MIKDDTILIYGCRPEIVLCHVEAKGVFTRLGYECIITDIIREIKSRYSLHPYGFAIDYKTKHIKGTLFNSRYNLLFNLRDELKKELPQCDIILEYIDTENEHIHLEFDPKKDIKFKQDKLSSKDNNKWPMIK